MAKLTCKCGYVMDLAPSPEPDLWIAIKDENYESLVKAENEADQLMNDYENTKNQVSDIDRQVSAMRTLIYNCPNCNRIYWYRGQEGQYEVFIKES